MMQPRLCESSAPPWRISPPTLGRSGAAMTSATGKVYCWTCRRSLTPARWERHIQSIGHVRRALGDPPPFVQPKTRQRAAEADALDEPDTRAQCGGCSRRITPGAEYWRDDGRVYHCNCVPLTTTRPLNPAQAAQAAPQQAGKLLAGDGVQLGTGRPQNG